MTPRGPASKKTRSARGEAGLTLVEVLVAMLLLVVVVLGILPLFTRSLAMNQSGREAGLQSALGRAQMEELLQLPFNHQRLNLTAGTELEETAFWTNGKAGELGDEGLVADRPSPTGFGDDVALWSRTTRVRQYSIQGVEDTDGDGVVDRIPGLVDVDRDGVFDNPLPAGTLAASVHLKEIEVTVEDLRAAGNPLGGSTDLRLQTLKSF